MPPKLSFDLNGRTFKIIEGKSLLHFRAEHFINAVGLIVVEKESEFIDCSSVISRLGLRNSIDRRY